MYTCAKFSCINFSAGGLGGAVCPVDVFHYVKKAISFIFNKLCKVHPSRINHNKNKELKKQQRWSTVYGKRSAPHSHNRK